MTAFRNPNWDKKSPQSAPNCIAGGRGLTQSLARASSPRATAGRFVESRRATNGFHTRSDARAPIDACGPPKHKYLRLRKFSSAVGAFALVADVRTPSRDIPEWD